MNIENNIPQYRLMARDGIKRAKMELSSNDDCRIKYAALELRFAMEAFIYERALVYKDEFPIANYSTWQPGQLLKALIEIDEYAGTGATLFIGKEDVAGVPAKEMQFLGQEHVLSIKDIKNNYDALGNFLHTPTVKQFLSKSTPSTTKQRERCAKILEILDKVISSPMFNFKIKPPTTSINCLSCSQKVVKRLPLSEKHKNIKAKCYSCGLNYDIEIKDSGETTWLLSTIKIPCAKNGCGQTIDVPADKLAAGLKAECPACHSINELAYEVILSTEETDSASETSSS